MCVFSMKTNDVREHVLLRVAPSKAKYDGPHHITDQFSSPRRAIGPVCVCVPLRV